MASLVIIGRSPGVKDCPFCGGTPQAVMKGRLFWIICSRCDATTAHFANYITALTAWQKRHTPTAVKSERAKRALRKLKSKAAATLIECVLLVSLGGGGILTALEGCHRRSAFGIGLAVWMLFLTAAGVWFIWPNQEDRN